MAEEKSTLKQLKEQMIEANNKFLADQATNADIIRAKDQVETGKINKSTIVAARDNQALMEATFAKMTNAMTKPLIKGANFSAMQLKQQASLQSKMSDIFANVAPDGVADAIKSLAAEVTHIPGAVEMLTEAAKKAKGNESKLDKLKAKEAKQDEMKKKFSFKENVEKVKAFSASAFDKIKGLILKGALFAIIMLLPKFLNSQLFQDILAAIKGDFSGLKQQFSDNFGKVIAGLTALFTIFFPGTMFFIIKSITGVFTNFIKGTKAFKAIMAGFKFMFTLIKVKMMSLMTSIGGIFSGLMTTLAPIFAAAAPFLLIAVAVAAAFFAIKFLLEKLRDGLNVSSVSDVIKIGIGYLQDGFAAVANFIIDIANWIMEKLGKAAAFFGFDFDFGAPIGKMATNNAQVATDKAQLNKRIADAKKEAALAEEEKNQTASGGGAIMANSGNTTNVNQSSTTQVMPSEMPDMTQFANYGEVQLA